MMFTSDLHASLITEAATGVPQCNIKIRSECPLPSMNLPRLLICLQRAFHLGQGISERYARKILTAANNSTMVYSKRGDTRQRV